MMLSEMLLSQTAQPAIDSIVISIKIGIFLVVMAGILVSSKRVFFVKIQLVVLVLAALMLWAYWARIDKGNMDLGSISPETFKLTGIGIVLFLLVTLLWNVFRHGALPDYIRQFDSGYNEVDGFAFSVQQYDDEDQFCLHFWYQNNYNKRCVARINAKLPYPVISDEGETSHLTATVECPPAGFGLYCFPLGIPLQYQGVLKKMIVSASVEYPEGQGKRMRSNVWAHQLHDYNKPVPWTKRAWQALNWTFSIKTESKEWLMPGQDVLGVLEKGYHSFQRDLWQFGDEVVKKPPVE